MKIELLWSGDDICKPSHLAICLRSPSVRRGQTTPKGLIKAKFTYFWHFFSFLDQTFQIDYDSWPNDIQFLFDAKC